MILLKEFCKITHVRRTLSSIIILLILIIVMQFPTTIYADGLDKPSPASSGTITIGNNILDAHVEDEPFQNGIGTYTVTTGSAHPFPGENVFYSYSYSDPSEFPEPWSTYTTVHVVDTMRDYVTLGEWLNYWWVNPDPGYALVNLDTQSPSTVSTPNMVTSSWSTAENLEIFQEVESIGTTVADTLIRANVRITNNDIVAHTVGIRYEWDLMIDGWDGAWMRPWMTPPTSPGAWLDTETEWISPTFPFWETSNMPESLFSVFGSVSSPASFTTPDRLVFANWAGASQSAYSYTPTGIVIGATEPSIGGQYDSTMLYYWNPTIVNPGESKEVTAYVTTFITAITPLSGLIDIDPNTLNLGSKGEWITSYIELPEDYDVADINISSILLNNTIPAEMQPTCIGDYDGDGFTDLMVKFDRASVTSYILGHIDVARLNEEGSMTITLTVTGKLNDGTPFEGSDTIKILRGRGGGRKSFLK